MQWKADIVHLVLLLKAVALYIYVCWRVSFYIPRYV